MINIRDLRTGDLITAIVDSPNMYCNTAGVKKGDSYRVVDRGYTFGYWADIEQMNGHVSLSISEGYDDKNWERVE